MKPPILSIRTLHLFLALIGTLLAILTSAHPVHERHHKLLAARERVPFWNDLDWGTKAPETPQPKATVMPVRPIPSPFLSPAPAVAPGVAPSKTTPLPAPAPAIAPLKPAASKSAPSTAPGVAPLRPPSSNPPIPGVAPSKPEKSCLDLSLWATASGPSPMMSVAGSLSKNKEPICSIWALVDQASSKPVELSCMEGHEASFRFNNGAGRYKGDGQPVNFNVVRSVEAKVDGKEAWSWRVGACWDE